MTTQIILHIINNTVARIIQSLRIYKYIYINIYKYIYMYIYMPQFNIIVIGI